jgi:LPXTG-motif cell wall-anchored protein
LKKLMLLVAMVAMALVAAAPVIAQPITQEFSESRNKSGAASPKTAISNTGNNVSLCPTSQQVTQTGEVLNEQGVVQYQTKTDDIDFTGSNITVDGASVTATCTQEIRQAAAAGPKAEAKAGKAEAKAPEAKAEAKAGKAEAKAELPKTGGVAGTASLLGLGAGALLVAGGLLARRIIR